MKNEIFNNRENGSWSWITVSKGRKYITLKYSTSVQGDRDVTIIYPLELEQEILDCLKSVPAYGILELIECIGNAPVPVKITRGKPIR